MNDSKYLPLACEHKYQLQRSFSVTLTGKSCYLALSRHQKTAELRICQEE
ncbi:hypothetical protein [Halorhodospira halochloris]|nr:hypothetical protein [Halorhodospira halochloris]MCG5547600.1 hypothetical protein [Halorhodospira halochloris]